MQDRYAGDIGDYIKLSLLRRLAQHRALGVAWWLTPNGQGNEDGRYTTYLQRPDDWSTLAPEVFDAMQSVVNGARSVAALERTGLLNGARFASERLGLSRPTRGSRADARRTWFEGVQRAIKDCDLIFVDPDNGIAPQGYNAERRIPSGA